MHLFSVWENDPEKWTKRQQVCMTTGRIKNNGGTENENLQRDSKWTKPIAEFSSKLKRMTGSKKSREHLLSFLVLILIILWSLKERRGWVKEGWSIMSCELPLSGAVSLLAVDKAELWQPHSILSSILIYRKRDHLQMQIPILQRTSTERHLIWQNTVTTHLLYLQHSQHIEFASMWMLLWRSPPT